MRVYDLAFSLGANCSAAHNLDIRGLRPFALPFDWVYFTDESTIFYLARALSTRFVDLMLKENMSEIKPGHPEWNPSHKGFLKFVDAVSGFRFVNHFRRPLEVDGEYEKVHDVLRRRIDRLFAAIDKGETFLLVLGTRVMISHDALRMLQEQFCRQWPGKKFHIECLQFNAPKDEDLDLNGGIIVHNVRRDWNTYDPERTNFEWRFLDDVKTKERPRRSKISFHLLPHFKVTIGWKRC